MILTEAISFLETTEVILIREMSLWVTGVSICLFVGIAVGFGVGVAVGFAVGDFVGVAVGFTVCAGVTGTIVGVIITVGITVLCSLSGIDFSEFTVGVNVSVF